MLKRSLLLAFILALPGKMAVAQTTEVEVPAPPSTPSLAEGGSAQSAVWARLESSSGGFTADQAAAAARRASPAVAQAEAQMAVSAARSRQTTSRFVPNLTLKGSYTRRSASEYDFTGGGFSVGALNEGGLSVGVCPDGISTNCVLDSAGMPVAAVGAAAFETPLNNYSLDLTLTVPFSDYVLALMPARRSAQADEAASRLQKEAEVQTAEVNARVAYYDWVKAQAQLAVVELAVASALARVDDARIGLDAGTVTSADALGLEGLAASSQLNLANAQSFLRLAEQNLRLLTQQAGPLAIGDDIARLEADVPALGSLASLIEHGRRHRAEARALLATARSVELGAQSVATGMYPRLDGVANVTHANPNQGFFPPGPEWNTSWFVGLSVSWRLDGYMDAQARRNEYAATAKALRAQLEALERGIEFEVRAAWEEWQRANAVETLSATELRAAEAMHEQRILLFRGGEATSTEVVEAELQRHNATLRSVQSAIDKRVAVAKMRRAAALATGAAAGSGK